MRLLRALEAADLTDDVTVPPVALVLQGGVSWPSAHSWADAVAAAVPTVEAVWWEPAVGAAVQLHGPANNRALSFAQVNPRVASALRRHVLDTIVRRAPRHVVDAYCGQGDLSEALAGHGMVVTAIEADAHATTRAAQRLRPFDGSRVLTGLVEDVLADTLPADVVVLNPPRRGLDVRVAATLADRRDIGALVYISCDPATLARDLSRLPRWQVASLRCFDMFPQTAHVESVCVLTPGDS